MNDPEFRSEQFVAEDRQKKIIRTCGGRPENSVLVPCILQRLHRRTVPCDGYIGRTQRASYPTKFLRLEARIGSIGRKRVIKFFEDHAALHGRDLRSVAQRLIINIIGQG